MTRLLTLFLIGAIISCSQPDHQTEPSPVEDSDAAPFLIVLGIAQDAGFPQIACEKDCCKPLWKQAHPGEYVVSLGLVDTENEKKYLFECTPDIRHQLNILNEAAQFGEASPSGIFLTHAHMGHYSGLMHFGREAMGSDKIPVHVMPRFESFLQNNGPWDQLIALENISLNPLLADSTVQLANFNVTPILVPHRDEYSETVGFLIEGPKKRVLFIPDIDKWAKWEHNLKQVITEVDIALLDATFFENGEIPGRDMSEIPHPFVSETMELLKDLPANEKEKVHFIHMNHTNPLLRSESHREQVLSAGFNIAYQGQKIQL